VIEVRELQEYMRHFGGPLEGCEVKAHPLAPFMVILTGMCSLDGQPHKYEAEFDRRGINDVTDILTVVETLMDNMGQAAAEARG